MITIFGISLLVATVIPQVLEATEFPDYGEKECFETREFADREEAEQEFHKWKSVLGDKFAGFNFNGLSDKSLTPTPLTVCIFTNR